MEASKGFPLGGFWNGRLYARKRVRAIFIELPLEIVVVTVYTYSY